MKEISVCRNCHHPVVWTFAFDGAEYYCLMCGGKTGMMGGKIDVEATPELKAELFVISKVFDAIRPFILGSGRFQRTNCKKCTGSELHGSHLKESELKRNEVAKNILALLAKK